MASRSLIVALLAIPTIAGPAWGYPSVFAPVPGNPADHLVALEIDGYRYDHARGCRRHPRAGTLAFRTWLVRHARGAAWSIMRCEKLGPRNWSLHADGRAIDWHLDVNNPAERREAQRLIGLLLATDSAGNPHALARRMGIQEIIWDCRSWFSGAAGMNPYRACYGRSGRRRRHVDDTTAHRNHIHFGLNQAGAGRRTSWWLQNQRSDPA